MLVQPAQQIDLPYVLSLLEDEKLPVSGVEQVFESFLVVKQRDQVLAAGAIEPHGADGLLRSVVVHPEQKGKGLGGLLVAALLESFDGDVYLLTETAATFFVRFGFESVSREVAPAAVQDSEEFRSLCPESATFMRRSVHQFSKIQ